MTTLQRTLDPQKRVKSLGKATMRVSHPFLSLGSATPHTRANRLGLSPLVDVVATRICTGNPTA